MSEKIASSTRASGPGFRYRGHHAACAKGWQFSTPPDANEPDGAGPCRSKLRSPLPDGERWAPPLPRRFELLLLRVLRRHARWPQRREADTDAGLRSRLELSCGGIAALGLDDGLGQDVFAG